MIPCNCVVQAGQIPAETEATLRANISAFTERQFGAPAEISWLAIPERSGFTASQPSTSAIVSMRAEPNRESGSRSLVERALRHLDSRNQLLAERNRRRYFRPRIGDHPNASLYV